MMREILFRGRTTGADGHEKGEWVYGNVIFMNPHPDGYDKLQAVIMPPTTYIAHGDIWGDFYWVDPKTVGQYIGRCDAHGRMIFEGDIIKCALGDDAAVPDNTFTVMWDDTCYFEPSEYEVVGNASDNPELLEEPQCQPNK